MYRTMASCQAAVADAVAEFGRVDVLVCCDGECECLRSRSSRGMWDGRRGWHWLTCAVTALVGTVEELAATSRTQSLAREQFETNFYGPINCIKAVLPTMRKQGGGHIVVLSSISTLPLAFPSICSVEQVSR